MKRRTTTNFRVIAEFEKENADGWLSYNRFYENSGEALADFNLCRSDDHCRNVQLITTRQSERIEELPTPKLIER